jgi:hypothetical protein
MTIFRRWFTPSRSLSFFGGWPLPPLETTQLKIHSARIYIIRNSMFIQPAFALNVNIINDNFIILLLLIATSRSLMMTYQRRAVASSTSYFKIATVVNRIMAKAAVFCIGKNEHNLIYNCSCF